MKSIWASTSMRFAIVFSALLLGYPETAAAQTVPTMTIKIFNNSPNYSIYPVLTTGADKVHSPWLQAFFQVRNEDLKDNPYPKPNIFRFYINPKGDGLAPKTGVTIVLPLLTQLVKNPDPKKPDQYIDWWGGGRVEFFDSPAGSGPPAALRAAYNAETDIMTPIQATRVPQCTACQPLTIFKNTTAFGNNEPAQAIEYTLGALKKNKNPVELVTNNVDIDVTYVDYAYLPAAITPFNKTLPNIAQVGYVGTPQPIDTFRAALNQFLAPKAPGAGWPQFLTSQNKKILKVPSLINLLLRDPKLPQPDITPRPWKPIDKLVASWKACLTNQDTPLCKKILDVRQLFSDNYANYIKIFDQKCDTKEDPIKLNEDLMIGHVYGWAPFGDHCPADANLLENTPGYTANNSAKYQMIKGWFDDLQYWETGEFAPYVLLIHGSQGAGPKYINAPNVYAYSVDDAVGNLQAEGTGFIVAIGGTKGLPNPNPAVPPINVNFGAPGPLGKFTHYGVCSSNPTKPVDPDFFSFGLSVAEKDINKCVLSLKTDTNKTYTFKLKTTKFPHSDKDPPPEPDYSTNPKWHASVNCDGISRDTPPDWCRDIKAYSVHPVGRGPDIFYAVTPGVYPAP